jgi:glycosyltransferase involved in cell wall biosynthesis
MKIAVYTIALNEEKHVERWYESSKEADYHVILDTGSTDKTVAIAKKLGIKVVKAKIAPWRFDVARNRALDAVPEDADYCISMDMDEILVPGWRQKLESVAGRGLTSIQNTFTYTFNPDGSPGMQFGSVRTHTRHDHHWEYPIHEAIMPNPGVLESRDLVDFEMQHHPDNNKSRGGYLPLLKMATEENPSDTRMAFYYGREQMFYQQNSEAHKVLTKFLDMPGAERSGDRSDAMIYIAKCCTESAEAEQWLRLAISTAPDRREAYTLLATRLYFQERFSEALSLEEKAIAIYKRPLFYMCDESAWNWEPWDIAAMCAWMLGDKNKALAYGTVAAKLAPHQERVQQNLRWFNGEE